MGGRVEDFPAGRRAGFAAAACRLFCLRSLGAGDWKLAGALGAFVGPEVLVDLLMGSVFVAGIMALGLVIYKRRFRETLRNIGRLLASMLDVSHAGGRGFTG